MSKRHLMAAIVAGAAALATNAHAQKTEITFARFFGACDSDYGTSIEVEKARGECGLMTTLVNHFNATNKDNIVVKPQIIEWGPYYQQLTARIAARDLPNIAVMHTAQIGDFIRSRVVEPIEDDLKAAGIDIEDFTTHARAGVTFNGKVHALPWDTHSWLWHINVGIFKQAGLVDSAGKPIIPKSVDELMAQAKTIKEKTGKPYFVMASVAAGDAGNGARTFYTLLYTQGGSLFPAGYDKVNFNTPEAKTAFETVERIAKEGYITKGVDGAGALGGFIAGNGAVLLAAADTSRCASLIATRSSRSASPRSAPTRVLASSAPSSSISGAACYGGIYPSSPGTRPPTIPEHMGFRATSGRAGAGEGARRHDHALPRRQLRLRLQLGGRRRPEGAAPRAARPRLDDDRAEHLRHQRVRRLVQGRERRADARGQSRHARRRRGPQSGRVLQPSRRHGAGRICAAQARLGAAARHQVLVPRQRDGRAVADGGQDRDRVRARRRRVRQDDAAGRSLDHLAACGSSGRNMPTFGHGRTRSSSTPSSRSSSSRCTPISTTTPRTRRRSWPRPT
jgi:hypothetical protein